MPNKINNKITSVQNPTIKNLIKIKNSKKSEYFLVENYHLVEEALKLKIVKKIFELENKNHFPEAIKISDNVFKKITDLKNPEGVIALCEKPKNFNLTNQIVFLNNVQDPGNVGTIIRTMLAYNFTTLFTNINIYNSKIIRSTQGAFFHINYFNVANNDYEILTNLKSQGYQIVISSLSKNSISYNKINYKNIEKIILVLGNEGKGIDKKIYSLADYIIYIPINFESLNVAIANGIILNEIYQQKVK
ncbi:RNA methyltransferase [Mycoplasma sp. 744]|uniref:TrmH family RNA methyltransferase n=1 Tax=Mycoplasma sp. 744 TaxID=3108531 RepID=UPI002B1E6640|nr:RNA methyltransferase [Mycoplasma sp. 744]MEA4115354.1 RNA methyltransferase [Mycoplasma sp. 744]